MAKPAIVFIGFMGAGKSTALAAARKAGLETTEIDELMERELGKPIRQAFEEDGEEAFRAREEEVVGALLENADGGAIALGGGSILSERIRKALDRHIVVLLEIDAATAWKRIEGTERPLATSEEDVARLLAERTPFYEELADAVVPVADRDVAERALPAIQALEGMPAETRLLWASSESGDYPIMVGRDLLGTDWWPVGGRRLCVTDENAGAYSGRLKSLSSVIEIKAGEKSKTLDQAGSVVRQLAMQQMTREDHVVALGGGVVGDLAGFCAHIYQRGVPVVQVPTTLVAQVDSAYGGKTGVDVGELKNYAGAYHLPAAVIADTSTLASLPERDLVAGFVEVIKTGLLAGGRLWRKVIDAELDDSAHIDQLVFDCARYKCEIVAADERDGNLRHVLNLGHTVGHAIEGVSGYSYLHGEAIGLGLLAALRLSDASELRQQVKALLVYYDLPTRLERKVSTDAILNALQRDKKRTAAGVGFVLLSEPGRPRTGEIVDPAKVRAAVEELY
ncbi:MAG TPA: bifunctional shikimate kinase/3-dehydroquinate synthase [Solirubrobacterales bacterium]|nr:bifunctional shikimate kinase/3-dehydroquinate synthase [Solirubrobacterales bacterium]